MKYAKNSKLIDYITAITTGPNVHFQSQIDWIGSVTQAIRAGNAAVALPLLQKAVSSNSHNYGFSELFVTALSCKDAKIDIPPRVSTNKKCNGQNIITPVFVACINPNEKVLKALIEQGGEIQMPDTLGYKPIHYAAACEGPEPLKYLLTLGQHVDEAATKIKVTPLMIAAKYGRTKNVELLLQNGAKYNFRNRKNISALYYAAKYGHFEVIKSIMDNQTNPKFDLDIGGKDRMTPLMIATLRGHKQCVIDLLKIGAKVRRKDKFKRSALIHACKSGQLSIASILLAEGSEYDYPDSSLNTPLHYACAYGWGDIAKLLLQAGAEVNKLNMWNYSPLEIALLKNHFGIVKDLLNTSKVDVNMEFDKGMTILHHTMTGITDQTLEELEFIVINKEANLLVQNHEKESALHLLTKFNKKEYIDSKLATENQNGFRRQNYSSSYNDLSIKKKQKQIAKEYDELFIKLFKILIRNKDIISLKNKQGKTALQLSLESSNFLLATELIEHTDDIISKGSNNKTILHIIPQFMSKKKGRILMGKILARLAKENSSVIINEVDDEGFSPILRLFYYYSELVNGFYKKISNKNIRAKKEEIIDLQLKQEAERMDVDEKLITENSAENSFLEPLNSSNTNPFTITNLNSNNIPFSTGININPFYPNNNLNLPLQSSKSRMKSNRTRRNQVQPLSNNLFSQFRAAQEDLSNLTEEQKEQRREDKINNYYLNSTEQEAVNKKSLYDLNIFIDHVFKSTVNDYIKMGANPHAQVQKLKNWRNWVKGQTIKKIEEQEEQDINNSYDSDGFVPYNGVMKKKIKSYNHKASFGTGYVPNYKTTISKLPQEKAQEYYEDDYRHYVSGVGKFNILMFLMKYPLIDLLKYLVDYFKLDVQQTDVRNRNLLFILIENNSIINSINPITFSSCLDTLLKLNINVNKYDNSGNSCIFLLSKLWDFNNMKLLYSYKADIDHMNNSNENPFIYYVRSGNKQRVELILNNFEINLNYKDSKGRTAVHYLYSDDTGQSEINVAMKLLILSRNPNINCQDIMGRTALHYLFIKINGDSQISCIDPIEDLSTLLDVKDIDVKVKDVFGNTPLHYASQRGATICAMSLINVGSDVLVKNNEQNTSLAYAIIFNQTNYAINLIQQGASIHDQAFPLLEKNEYKYIEKLKKELLDNSIDVNKKKKKSSKDTNYKNNKNMELDNIDDEDNNSQYEYSDEEAENNDDNEVELQESTYYGKSLNNRNPFRSKSSYNDSNYQASYGYNNSQYQQHISTDFSSINNLFKTDEEKELGISLYRLCVKRGYQGLIYLFVNKGYDLMMAIQDALYEGKFNYAMLLLNKSPYNEVYQKVNNKGQNLFHILSIYGSNVSDATALQTFFEKLLEKGIDFNVIFKLIINFSK